MLINKWNPTNDSSYPVIGVESEPYSPTIDDLANFTAGFETFRPDVYELETLDKKNSQLLTGFGFSDQNSINLAKQGKMTKDTALSILKNKLQSEYNEWGRLLKEFNNLPEYVKLSLVDTSFNGKGVQGTINTSPNLVNAIKSYDGSDTSEIAKHMTHSKNAGGWLGVRSSARRAMALNKYDWQWKERDKYGRQIDSSTYKGPEDWKSSPYYRKYQKGGNIYSPFVPNDRKEEIYDEEPVYSDYKYPIIPVTPHPIQPVQLQKAPVIEEPEIPEEKPIADTSKLKVNGANNDNLTYINTKLSEAGIPKLQRAAILATIVAESGADPKAIGDKGKAHGLFQWHQDRYKAGPDLDSQIQLILDEVTNLNYKNGWGGRKKDFADFNGNDLQAAVRALTKGFIRPADIDGQSVLRYNIAQRILKQLS